MNQQFSPELLAKAHTAESPEALLALAAENGTALTPEEAQAHFNLLHQTGELADEELDNVAGGGCKNGGKMVVTALYSCLSLEGDTGHWVCKVCGKPYQYGYTEDYGGYEPYHYCQGKTRGSALNCSKCKHCTYERGLLLCNNPAAY